MSKARSTADELERLREMQAIARDLAQTEDPLMVGQYDHLQSRIAALILIVEGAAS